MTIFVTFVDIAFSIFVDARSITDTISLNSIPEVSAILFEYLPFSQIHVLGFQV